MSFRDSIQGIFIFLVFVLIFGFLVYGSQVFLDESRNLSSVSGALANMSQNSPQRSWNVPELNIQARSALVMESDLETEKNLYSKNADTKLPIASLTKLMSAIVVLDNYNLRDAILVDKVVDFQEPLQNNLKPGDTLSVENILRIMLIDSSNKAAYALAEKIGVQKFTELMNQKTIYIGLQNTSFAEPSGLSEKNYSTARDLAKLAEHIIKNYPVIIEISGLKEFNVPNFGVITNKNELLGQVSEIIGGKTGFTNAAQGCLFLAVNNAKANDYLIYVVLGSEDRFLEMKNIINWVNSAYIW